MQVPANDFSRLWNFCRDDVLAAVERVCGSGWYILGQEVEAFERALALFGEHRVVVGCGNGMDALEIALRGLGLRPGDAVLTTPFSAFATGLAILRAGGEPVYCDVDAHGLLDPEAVEACLDAHPEIRFLIPVHLYGNMADMPALCAAADRRGVVVIEDAAQAVGATRDGIAVGRLGRAAAYSFYPTKNLGAIGDGGALATNDAELASRARSLRNYGQGTYRYVHESIGLNSRLDEVQAAILKDAFLPRLAEWTARRREIARIYLTEIRNDAVTLLPVPDPECGVRHLFPVLAPPGRAAALINHLNRQGVQAGRHYPGLIPEQPAMKACPSAPRLFGNLSRAAAFADREVSLPINPFMTYDEARIVTSAINDWPA
jgi:dTDP-3-amino-3,4,6-trideoxy-alpha-D-glucose transaminase